MCRNSMTESVLRNLLLDAYNVGYNESLSSQDLVNYLTEKLKPYISIEGK